MFKYALLIFYHGVPYSGWQRQGGSERASVQSALEDTLFIVTGEKVPVIGSGRTDAGVHAAAQVAQIVLHKEWLPSELKSQLNTALEGGQQLIRIRSAIRVDKGFNCHKFSAGKQYSYYVLQGTLFLF